MQASTAIELKTSDQVVVAPYGGRENWQEVYPKEVKYGQLDKLKPEEFHTLERLDARDLTFIFIELADERFQNRVHYNNSTYNAGCRGLLCTTAHTDFARWRRYLKDSHRDEESLRPARYNTTARERALAAYISTMLVLEMRDEPGYLAYQLVRCELSSPHDYNGRSRVDTLMDAIWERMYQEKAEYTEF